MASFVISSDKIEVEEVQNLNKKCVEASYYTDNHKCIIITHYIVEKSALAEWLV